MSATTLQIIITALLSSGFVSGFIALLSKTVWSPESKNELARLGNEFAQQLLLEARSERQELRVTIQELEATVNVKNETINRLKHLAEEKDAVIHELEERQVMLAQKLQDGKPITLQDIFGDRAPKDFHLALDDPI